MVKQDLITELASVFSRFEDAHAWKQYFMEIMSESYSTNKNLSVSAAKKPCNQKYNRYTDVLAYDQTRVMLPNYNDTDYINANFVDLDNKFDRRYILAQGPLTHTVPHFWSMIWENGSLCVIMVTKDIEQNKVKCAQYYPTTTEPIKTIKFRNFNLVLSLERSEANKSYKRSVIKVMHSVKGETRYVDHFYYDTWPDFGVPNHPNEFLQFLWDVRASGGLRNANKPAVVHCSAGIGRSGTFVVVDLALLFVEHNETNKNESLDVKQLIMNLRKCRYGLVQSPEQLRFLYQAILKGATEIVGLNGSARVSSIKFANLENKSSMNNCNTDEDLPPLRLTGLRSEVDDDSDDMSEPLGAEHANSVYIEEERDSDFDEANSEADYDNSALENAAQAVRNRRGIPVSNGGFEGSFELTKHQNTQNSVKGSNSNNSRPIISTDSGSTNTTKTTSTLQTDTMIHGVGFSDMSNTSQASQLQRASILTDPDSRDSRAKRTRVLIQEIRENMRRRDLERERYYWGIPRIIRQYCTTENVVHFLWRATIIVTPIASIAALYFFQKMWSNDQKTLE